MPDATFDLLPGPSSRWALRCSPRAKELASLVPGLRYDRTLDAWVGPATWTAALAARHYFGEGLSPTDAAFDHAARFHAEADAAAALYTADPEQVRSDHDLPDTLFGFQVPSTALMRGEGGWFLNCDDRGNGKSVQAACALPTDPGSVSLVVCTKSMLHTWADEIATHSPTILPVVLQGNAPKRRRLISEARTAAVEDGRPVAIICTWDVLKAHTRHASYGSVTLKGTGHDEPKEFNEPPGWITTVVADEAHACKTAKAQRTRALWAVGDTARQRIALTATPVTNTPLDLWGILRFLDPASFPSRSKFRDRYVLTYENPWGGVEDLGLRPDSKDELFRLLSPHFCRRTLQVPVTTLPAQVRWLDMDTKQAKAYRTFESEMIAQVDSGLLVATDPLVRDMRLHQMAAATPVLDDEGAVTALTAPSCKIDALIDLIGETPLADSPLVVFAESRKLIELAYSVLHGTDEKPGILYRRVATITGQVSAEERHSNVARFQQGGPDGLDVLLLTIGAGSEGITLTRSNTAVFLQRSYRMVGNIQAEGRILRHGQTRDCQFIDFITLGTIEERLHRAVADKEDTLQEFTRDPDYARRILTGAS